MAKLTFKYASMNAGKSAILMQTAYNYNEQGCNVIVLKPGVDTKGDDKVVSRIGLERKVDYFINKDDSVKEILKGNLYDISCIFVDEAQFLSAEQVDELDLITKSMNIPVIAYGLKTNFQRKFFEGSKRLCEVSDVTEELKTLCGECRKINPNCRPNNAKAVGRQENGEYVRAGKEVVIDGEKNVEYVPLCGACYHKKVLGEDLEEIKRHLLGEIDKPKQYILGDGVNE